MLARSSARERTHAVCLALALVCSLALVLLAHAAVRAHRANAGPEPRRGRMRDLDATPLSVASSDVKSSLAWPSPDLATYPRTSSRAAPIVYLHGIHGRPENGCPWMRGAGAPVLCPRADTRHADGTASWSGTSTAAVVTRALLAANETERAPVVVGFSQGAYEVDALVRAGMLRARAIVLLGAHVAPDARAIRASGIVRVVLGAGELDATYPGLAREAARLAHDGIEVRLVSLGHVGHVYVADDPEVLRGAIAWAAGERDSAAATGS